MKNTGVFFSLSLMFLFTFCCFMLLNIQIDNYTMLERRTKSDFETYTPVSYITNKIHNYDEKNGVRILAIDNKKVIKLQDSHSDTYLYKNKSKLMELCVVSGMQPDFSMGQVLMSCKEFNVWQEKNTVFCKINGIEFQVELRSEGVS